MTLTVLLVGLLTASSPPAPSFAEAVQDAYSRQAADSLQTLLARADSQSDSLLVRYRLYPLTEDASLLQDLPRELDDGSARDWALLSGLWSYRAGEASFLGAINRGRHSADLLETAQSRDPDNPYVLLVGGQSLLFRPSIAGKDPEEAAERFRRLVRLAERGDTDGIPPMEARVWRWMALRETDRTDRARRLRKQLLGCDPPPLYRQFLESPPDV
jgi:hypothetical protein